MANTQQIGSYMVESRRGNIWINNRIIQDRTRFGSDGENSSYETNYKSIEDLGLKCCPAIYDVPFDEKLGTLITYSKTGASSITDWRGNEGSDPDGVWVYLPR